MGTLLLRPDAGVGHGWVPNRFDEDGYTQEELKDFEFEESWKEDFYLHKTSDDILYTIGFTKA